MAISAYSPLLVNKTAADYETSETKDSTSLSMDDFFQLLAAQLQNQNMLDPVDNTEYIAQMAQFSTLSQMQELANSFQTTYAVSLIGKHVDLSSVNPNGSLSLISGNVEEVAFENGTPYVKIDGSYYETKSILAVQNGSETTSSEAVG